MSTRSKSRRSVWSSASWVDSHSLVTVSGGRSNLDWYINLRWIAVTTQVLVVVAGFAGWHAFGSILTYAVVAALTALTSILAHRISPRLDRTDLVTFGLLLLDVVLLTCVLRTSGGPASPLVLLYIVHVGLGAVMVQPSLGWPVGAAAVLLYGVLFLLPPTERPSWLHNHFVDTSAFRRHLLLQWATFSGVAVVLAYFVTRVTRSLIQREREIARFAEREARSERMASLATLATGAAHELGTPLGTIGLAATELERALERAGLSADLIEDVRLIRSQTERCRVIIDSMRSETGEDDEKSASLEVDDLIDQARQNLPPGYSERIRIVGGLDASVFGPKRALVQAFRNLLKNGLDASLEHGFVSVAATVEGNLVQVMVRDSGKGIEPEVLSRIGEPFFTTKEAGRGMGLGLFVTHAIIERAGGTMQLDSEPGVGTKVTVVLPAAGVQHE